jgi:hypothetical protein
LIRIEDQCLSVGNLWKRGGMRACVVGGFYVEYKAMTFGLWGVLCVRLVASTEVGHVGYASMVWDYT